MLNPKRKTEPANPAPMSVWDAARHRWADVQGTIAGLETKRQGISLALSLARNPRDGERVAERLKVCAAPYLQAAEDHPDRLVKQLRAVDDEIEAFAPTVRAAAEEFEVAKRQEIRRRAVALQPEHREAVRAIADALDALEAGIAAERSVRSRIGLGTSSYLPNVGDDFNGLEIDGWRRKVRGLGIIE